MPQAMFKGKDRRRFLTDWERQRHGGSPRFVFFAYFFESFVQHQSGNRSFNTNTESASQPPMPC